MTATDNGRSFALLKFPESQPKPQHVSVSPLLQQCIAGLAVLEQLDPRDLEALALDIEYTIRQVTGTDLTVDELVTHRHPTRHP